MEYRVSGPFAYRDVPPGETFTAEPNEALATAVDGGFIAPVKATSSAKPSGKAKTPPAPTAEKEN